MFKGSNKVVITALLVSAVLLSGKLLNEYSDQLNRYEKELSEKKVELKLLRAEMNEVNNFYDMLLENMKDLGSVDVTMYQPEPGQTDDRYWETADQSIINMDDPASHRWVAISRDLHVRWGGKLDFGDFVWISGVDGHTGMYQVRDIMNRRFRQRVDILLGSDDPQFSYVGDTDIRLYKLPKGNNDTFADVKRVLHGTGSTR